MTVPHVWLREVLFTVKAPLSVQRTLERLQQKWSSVFCVETGENAVRTELTYRRGVFQGDSLSPLLYCLSIVPISHALWLRKTGGYWLPYLDHPVTHQYFMDNLKVHAKSSNALDATLRVVDRVSHAKGMDLGLRKYAFAHVKKGKCVSGENYLLPEERTIEQVPQGDAYKYLSIEQLFTADHTSVRVCLQQV